MTNGLERNIRIKKYIAANFAKEDPILREAKNLARERGLPAIEVSPSLGKLLYLLAKIHQPKRVLEIGTLGGYSTLWLAKALGPDGQLISLEYDSIHATVARTNIERAGLTAQVAVHQGLASILLKDMVENHESAFDLIFIDADKETYPIYLHWALALSHLGTVILCDNLIPRENEIGVPDPADAEACGIYQFNELIASHPRLESILVPTIVGERGRVDALGIARVKD